MNASKLLVSSIAALSVVGVIGFANAQSTAPSVAQPDSQSRQLDPNANMNNNSALPSSQSGSSMNNTTPSTTTTDSTLQRNADLPAQMDRN